MRHPQKGHDRDKINFVKCWKTCKNIFGSDCCWHRTEMVSIVCCMLCYQILSPSSFVDIDVALSAEEGDHLLRQPRLQRLVALHGRHQRQGVRGLWIRTWSRTETSARLATRCGAVPTLVRTFLSPCTILSRWSCFMSTRITSSSGLNLSWAM